MFGRLLLAGAVGSALTLASTVAFATPNFPDVIAAKLGGPAPDCTICHTNPAGGRGNVTTPFGSVLRERGLQAYDEDSLNRALDALAGENRDTDGDGTSDVAELRAGTDPNGASGDTITPEYGCGVGPLGRETDVLAAACALLAATAVLANRRRRAG